MGHGPECRGPSRPGGRANSPAAGPSFPAPLSLALLPGAGQTWLAAVTMPPRGSRPEEAPS
jgi:hypothetical protein